MRPLSEININNGLPQGTRETVLRKINEIQEYIGTEVPDILMEFYLQSNGGHPELDTIYYGSGQSFGIDFFLPLVSESSNDVLSITKTMAGFLPRSSLILAMDGGGDYLYWASSDNLLHVYSHDPINPSVNLDITFEELIDNLTLNEDYI